MTTHDNLAARTAQLDQLYAQFNETLERLAPVLARYRQQLVDEGIDRHEAAELVQAVQDKFLGDILSGTDNDG